MLTRRIALNGGGCCCGGTSKLPCGPCPIPKKNLTLTYTDSRYGTTTTTLIYTASPDQWNSSCVVVPTLTGTPAKFQFTCALGNFNLIEWAYFTPDTSCTGSIAFTNTWDVTFIVDYTCVPFHIHYGTTFFTDIYIDE